MKPWKQSKCPQQGPSTVTTVNGIPVLKRVSAHTALGTCLAHLSALPGNSTLTATFVAGALIISTLMKKLSHEREKTCRITSSGSLELDWDHMHHAARGVGQTWIQVPVPRMHSLPGLSFLLCASGVTEVPSPPQAHAREEPSTAPGPWRRATHQTEHNAVVPSVRTNLDGPSAFSVLTALLIASLLRCCFLHRLTFLRLTCISQPTDKLHLQHPFQKSGYRINEWRLQGTVFGWRTQGMLNAMCREGTVPKRQQRQKFNGSRSQGGLKNQMHFNLSSATCCVTRQIASPFSTTVSS